MLRVRRSVHRGRFQRDKHRTKKADSMKNTATAKQAEAKPEEHKRKSMIPPRYKPTIESISLWYAIIALRDQAKWFDSHWPPSEEGYESIWESMIEDKLKAADDIEKFLAWFSVEKERHSDGPSGWNADLEWDEPEYELEDLAKRDAVVKRQVEAVIRNQIGINPKGKTLEEYLER